MNMDTKWCSFVAVSNVQNTFAVLVVSVHKLSPSRSGMLLYVQNMYYFFVVRLKFPYDHIIIEFLQ